MHSPVRFSSCRGVAFEAKPHKDHNASETSLQPIREAASSMRLQPFRWLGSSKVFSSPIRTSMSRPSSHFCDLDLDDDDDDDDDDDYDYDDYDYDYDDDGDDGAAAADDDGGDDDEDEEEEEEEVDEPEFSKEVVQDLEKQTPKVARKPDSRLSIILLDQGLFTVYKRLFAACFVLNITALFLAASGNFPYGRRRATLFSIANILALTLCRSEAFLRLVFWLAVHLLGRPWIPLFVKTATTSLLQSLGGIHSGCGVSSIAWLVYALILTLNDRQNSSPEIIAAASAILALLCLSSLAAFPLVRHLHHNVFERIHRFAGWTALTLLWAFIILTLSYDPETGSYSRDLQWRLFKQQEFWFTFAITLLIVLPWLSVRRVAVKVSAPSGHASIIKFAGGVKAGLLGRISPSPFSEWHAFGIISDGKGEHMMLAGAVGDFTKSLVSEPPSHLWVRQVHFAGLPYLVNMYRRVVLVATGSGICVFLSFLLQESSAEVCVVWVAKGIEKNFGREIKEMMSSSAQYGKKRKVIVHDTAVLGRPEVSKMSVEAAREWGAEVVIVTSNPQGSRDVVNASKSAGIPAFGPIWDS